MKIAFAYHGRHRVLEDPVVKFTKQFNLIIVGTDADHGGIRTFRVDRIEGKVKHLVVRRGSAESAPIPGQRRSARHGHG